MLSGDGNRLTLRSKICLSQCLGCMKGVAHVYRLYKKEFQSSIVNLLLYVPCFQIYQLTVYILSCIFHYISLNLYKQQHSMSRLRVGLWSAWWMSFLGLIRVTVLVSRPSLFGWNSGSQNLYNSCNSSVTSRPWTNCNIDARGVLVRLNRQTLHI